MLDLKSMIDGDIPAVSSGDIERLWSWQSKNPADVSISTKAISQLCESADPIAAGARTMLLGTLLGQGLLENWRDNDGLNKAVFDAAATFPLPNGLRGLNPSEFIALLPAS